jgi:cytochrome d ubiquinol oxidase subunit I
LAFVVAGLETAWMRTRDPTYLRLTKFVGNLFVINLAAGVVAGIVQEFQFG